MNYDEVKHYAENVGKKNIFIFVLIDLKREIKEDTVFVMGAKTLIWKVFRKRRLFDENNCCIQLKPENFWKF